MIYFKRADKGKPGESRGRKATDLRCVLFYLSFGPCSPRLWRWGRARVDAGCEVWCAIWWLRCRSAKWGPPFPAVLSAPVILLLPFAPSSSGGFLFWPGFPRPWPVLGHGWPKYPACPGQPRRTGQGGHVENNVASGPKVCNYRSRNDDRI